MNNVDLGRYSKRIVQYLWDPEPTNDAASTAPIWCLGQRYEAESHEIGDASSVDASSGASDGPERAAALQDTQTDEAPTPPHALKTEGAAGSRSKHTDSDRPASTSGEEPLRWPSAFLDDFESRIWLTYRSGFPAIPKSQDPKAASSMSLSVRLKSQLTAQSGFTSDTGWGCMIRSGQCLLANALALLHLGRDWRRGTACEKEKEILRLFADDPDAPLSIHSFVHHGAAACGTYPGQWFGPSATAKCVEALTQKHQAAGLKVYVTGDGPDVFEETIFSIAKDGSQNFQPTLLLVGTRLGIDRVTPVYRDALLSTLQLPQSVGIAGGRPSASHYFVGAQGSNFFYLDPHHTRPALPFHEAASDYTPDEVDSCHTRRLRRMPIDEMDPSMLIAFLVRDEEDWRAWRRSISQSKGKAIVHVADSPASPHGFGTERDGALDEVQTFDDEDDHDHEIEPA